MAQSAIPISNKNILVDTAATANAICQRDANGPRLRRIRPGGAGNHHGHAGPGRYRHHVVRRRHGRQREHHAALGLLRRHARPATVLRKGRQRGSLDDHDAQRLREDQRRQLQDDVDAVRGLDDPVRRLELVRHPLKHPCRPASSVTGSSSRSRRSAPPTPTASRPGPGRRGPGGGRRSSRSAAARSSTRAASRHGQPQDHASPPRRGRNHVPREVRQPDVRDQRRDHPARGEGRAVAVLHREHGPRPAVSPNP
jgi:hypothetical protein